MGKKKIQHIENLSTDVSQSLGLDIKRSKAQKYLNCSLGDS